jgi:hypothetical protein
VLVGFFVACGAKATAPNPALFVGDWQCTGAPDGGVVELVVSEEPPEPGLSGTNLLVSTPGATQLGCTFRYVVDGASAQLPGCVPSVSAQWAATSGCDVLLCGTITLEDGGGGLEGSFTFANGEGQPMPTQNVSCTRGLGEDAGIAEDAADDGSADADSSTVLAGEDAGFVDVQAACASSRDVFFAQVSPNPNPNQGSLGSNTLVFTDLDSQWIFDPELGLDVTAVARPLPAPAPSLNDALRGRPAPVDRAAALVLSSRRRFPATRAARVPMGTVEGAGAPGEEVHMGSAVVKTRGRRFHATTRELRPIGSVSGTGMLSARERNRAVRRAGVVMGRVRGRSGGHAGGTRNFAQQMPTTCRWEVWGA